jgi:hypothetical protein
VTRVSSLAGTIIAIAVLSLATAASTIPAVYSGQFNHDDATWGKRALEPWWFPEPRLPKLQWGDDYARKYYYCIDHPAVTRIIYGAALHATGVRTLDIGEWDDRLDEAANVAEGRVLPYRVMITLRMVNLLLFAGAVIIAYFAFDLVIGNRILACLAALALAVDGAARAEVNGTVTYIGTDAPFLFWALASWFVWLKASGKGIMGPLVVGAVAGIATATKLTGAFIVLGAAGYWCVYSGGWRRLAYPLVTCAAAVTAFVLLNPVYLGGGIDWAIQVFRDMLSLRFQVRQEHLASVGTYTRLEVILSALPHLVFAIAAAGIMVAWRRAWWFGATAFWSISLIAFHMLFLYRFMPRYAVPMRAAFIALVMAAGMSTVKAFMQRKDTGGAHEFCAKGDG